MCCSQTAIGGTVTKQPFIMQYLSHKCKCIVHCKKNLIKTNMFSGLSHAQVQELEPTLGFQVNALGIWRHTDALLPSIIQNTVPSFSISTPTLENPYVASPVQGVTQVFMSPLQNVGPIQRHLVSTIIKSEYQQPVLVKDLIVRYPAVGTSAAATSSFSTPFPPRNANPVIVFPVATRYEPQNLPEQFNWADSSHIRRVFNWEPSYTLISPVVNQYSCGGCWAISVTSALADRLAIWSRTRPVVLSATSILACVSSDTGLNPRLEAPDTLGCSGGLPISAVEMLALDGALLDPCAPYNWCERSHACSSPFMPNVSSLNTLLPGCESIRSHNRDWPCSTRVSISVYDSGRAFRTLVDVHSIQQEILTNGPVVATYAVYEDFLAGTAAIVGDDWSRTKNVYCNVQVLPRPYVSTRYSGSESRLTGYHAVEIVGWGVEKQVKDWRDASGTATLDIPYWVIKNSWGVNWNKHCEVDKVRLPGYFKCAMTNPELKLNTHLFLDNADNGLLGAVIAFQPAVVRNIPMSSVFKITYPVEVELEVNASSKFARLNVGWDLAQQPVVMYVALSLIILVLIFVVTVLALQYKKRGRS